MQHTGEKFFTENLTGVLKSFSDEESLGATRNSQCCYWASYKQSPTRLER